MKSQLEQQIRSAVRAKHKQLQCSKKQVLLTQMQQESTRRIRNEFFKDLCDAVVAADIPWYKLQVQSFVIFLKSTARSKFQMNLCSARTTCMHVIKKRL
jgi:hypothetical protein